MSTPSEPVTHAWVRARFGTWAAGILDVDQRRAFDDHLATCESCRKAGQDLVPAAPWADRDEHIPSGLVANWNRRAPELAGEVRELIRHHIERCEDCRRELQTLGLDADLIRKPTAAPAAAAARPQPSGTPRITLVPSTPHAQRGRPSWTLRVAMAATLLAVIAGSLVLYRARLFQTGATPPVAGTPPSATLEAPSPGSTPAPTTHYPPVSGSTSTPSLMALGPVPTNALTLTETIRGTESNAGLPVATFDPVRHEIAITPPQALVLADGDRVEIEVLDDAGRTRRSLVTRLNAIFPTIGPRAIVLRQGDPTLEPGTYLLWIRVNGRAGSVNEESTYAFEIR